MINLITQLLCSAQKSKEKRHEGFYYLISPGIRWSVETNFISVAQRLHFI